MAPSDELDEETVRTIVREELNNRSRTLVGTIFWTILSVFTIFVGLQFLQVGLYTTSLLTAVGFTTGGVFVVGASLYLLYLLHWV